MAITANKDNGIITGYTDVRDISATKILTTEYDSDFGFLSEKVTQKAGGDGLEFNDLDIAFQDAYLSIISSLPEYLSKTALLTFESDLSGYQIYDATASLVARVSFSSNPDRWENGDGTETINVHSNFNFHDSDWNNLGDVNSWERYEVDAGAALDVTKLADDAAKKAAGLVEYGSGQSTTTELVRGTGEDLGDLTDTIASLLVLDSDDDVVSSEINMVRTWKDTWNDVENDESNSNERQEFFVTSENDNWGEFVGSIVKSDGMVAILNDSGDILSKSITGDGMSFGMISEDPGFLEIWNELENVLPESVTSNKINLQFYFAEDSSGDEQIWLYLDGDMMVEANIKSSYFTLPTGSFFQTFENETINLSDVNGDLIANVSSTFTYTHSDEYFFDDQHLTYQSTTFTYETLNVSEYEQEYNYFVGDYIDWSDVGSIKAYETTEYLEDETEKKSSSFEFMALPESVGSKFLGTLEIEGASMILRDATGGILDSNVEIEADAPAVVASISDADAGITDTATVSINRIHDEDITIDYTISADNNFNTIIGEMTISAGKKSGSIDMSVVPENAIDNNESFNVKLSNISIGSISNDTAIITFADDDSNDSTGNQSDIESDDDTGGSVYLLYGDEKNFLYNAGELDADDYLGDVNSDGLGRVGRFANANGDLTPDKAAFGTLADTDTYQLVDLTNGTTLTANTYDVTVSNGTWDFNNENSLGDVSNFKIIDSTGTTKASQAFHSDLSGDDTLTFTAVEGLSYYVQVTGISYDDAQYEISFDIA